MMSPKPSHLVAAATLPVTVQLQTARVDPPAVRFLVPLQTLERYTMKRLVVAAVAALMMVPAPANAATVDYVVDGDTIRLRSGVYVRLIGIDTPEVGECGYRAAKRKLDQWVGGQARLVNPAGVDDRDHYGRLIRYVHDSGRDRPGPDQTRPRQGPLRRA